MSFPIWWRKRTEKGTPDVLMVTSHAESGGVRHSVMNPTDRMITGLKIDSQHGHIRFKRLRPFDAVSWWEPNNTGHAVLQFDYDIEVKR